MISPAAFSADFQRKNGQLLANKYVTKFFFGDQSFEDERDMNVRVKEIFKDHDDLFLQSYDDVLDMKQSDLDPVLAEMKHRHGWNHTTNTVCNEVIHYPYAGIDLSSPDFTPKHTEILQILQVLLRTVAVLNEKMCIHRDIKLANIVYNKETGAVRLIDYGLAEMVNPRKGFPAYDNWDVAYYEPPETVLNIGHAGLRELFTYLDTLGPRVPIDLSNPVLARLISQHAMSLLGGSRYPPGPRLEEALDLNDLFGDAGQTGQKRKVPAQTRQDRLANKIVEAVKRLSARYTLAGDRTAFHLRRPRVASAYPARQTVMADIVKAYNAYQVGQLLHSLIDKSALDSDKDSIRQYQSWADSLLQLDMDDRLTSWDRIVREIATSREAFIGPPRKARRAPL